MGKIDPRVGREDGSASANMHGKRVLHRPGEDVSMTGKGPATDRQDGESGAAWHVVRPSLHPMHGKPSNVLHGELVEHLTQRF
ncbi:MAG TPA: hypothetical protein VGN31_15620, partial [Paraburkholderia sp.]